MQSNLEKEGISQRQKTILRNDYSRTDEYSETHKDAISDGDPQGKGTKSGGHGFSVPDFKKSPDKIAYQINTGGDDEDGITNIGGDYDINGGPGGLRGNSGRNYLQLINVYSPAHQYGPECPEALSDGDVRGKGVERNSGHGDYSPNWSASHTARHPLSINTEGGGGKYDIEGRTNLDGSGRNRLLGKNLYSPGNAYYEDIKINTEENIMDGQFRLTI